MKIKIEADVWVEAQTPQNALNMLSDLLERNGLDYNMTIKPKKEKVK